MFFFKFYFQFCNILNCFDEVMSLLLSTIIVTSLQSHIKQVPLHEGPVKQRLVFRHLEVIPTIGLLPMNNPLIKQI